MSDIEQNQTGDGNTQIGSADHVSINIDKKHPIGTAPRRPLQFMGRLKDLEAIKLRLGIKNPSQKQPLTVITGWPGVGKTSFTSYLAYESDVLDKYTDGILWISLGPDPSVLSKLAEWGRALGNDELIKANDPTQASNTLRAMLSKKHMLLIVDDVWSLKDGDYFLVGGPECATLVTTRDQDIASAMVPTKNDVYLLDVMTEKESLELIEDITSGLVTKYPEPCRNLVNALERLPLSLQVAGHLLNIESGHGFGVEDLIKELQEGILILKAKPPQDRIDQKTGSSLTVAALLETSIERLDDHTRECYAMLGAFAPKPATFEIKAMAYVWNVEDPKPIVGILVGRGLLEPIPENRYWMHAILAAHAKMILSKL